MTTRSPRKISKRVPRRAKLKAPAWRKILITDLHVSSKTIDLVLATLAHVRLVSETRGIKDVVCLGDFWDARNILSVRHIHRLMEEFTLWKDEGINLVMIPGNHDQVSVDGEIHGVRVFEQFSNISIATHPIRDDEQMIVYLPWREDPEEQADLFANVRSGYTVLAHAEAPGALANGGKRMAGRFDAGCLSRVRAIYLGHFHKRQKLGDNCWYIGNPFEKDFGEMGDPKGIAIISSDDIEPEWIEQEGLPLHFRLTYPSDVGAFEVPRTIDIVEVYASRADMETIAYEKAVATIEARDKRLLPLQDPKRAAAAPTFALGLLEAVDEYATLPEAWGGVFTEDDIEQLRAIGRQILAEVPDAGMIAPMASKVTPLSVEATNFCAIEGTVYLDLKEQGTLLLQGEMGVGKTSLCDAMTWALYDKTTPRKAGSSGSSLRADDVINEEHDHCTVAFRVLLDDTHEVTITREKTRGKGSRVDFNFPAEIPMPSGISDQQELVNKVIGIDYELWRTCVYLGQGSVGNFITDGDKKRKELLSRAFQLGSCPHAQKLVRSWLKEARNEMAPITQRLHENRARVEALATADFAAEMASWEARRTATIKDAQQAIADAQTKVADLDEKLKAQPQWEESEKQHSAHLSELERQLTNSSVPERAGKIHAAIGAAEAEHSLAQRDLGLLMKSYSASQTHGTTPTCPECGQVVALSIHEDTLQNMEAKIESKRQEVTTFEHTIANHKQKLGQLTMEGGAAVESLKKQVDEARQNLSKVRQGLEALRHIRTNRTQIAGEWEKALASITELQKQLNPFKARQEQKEAQVADLQKVMKEDEEALQASTRRTNLLAFWEDGFGAKGVPVLVLRTVLHELETHANRFLAKLTKGTVFTQLEMLGDDLVSKFYKFEPGRPQPRERSFLQLSGGERRCVEMSFSPFALSEMIFARTGVRIPLLVIDELTTHLSARAKPQVCAILSDLGRDTVVVIDHDPSVQGAFDLVYEVEKESDGSVSLRRI